MIRRWIEAGAPGLPSAEEAARPGPDHWAFIPPERPQPPTVAHADQVRTDVDRFILAELERRGLQLAAPASATTLVRRVSIDLTGLPPSPEEIAAFLADTAPGAVRAHGRALPCQPALRRTLGPALARCRGLRRQQWLFQCRYRSALGVSVSRLRGRSVQRRQAV